MTGTLHGRALPLRAPVLDGECLDSWLEALARRNGISVSRLLPAFGWKPPPSAVRLSLGVQQVILRRAERQAGLPPGRLDKAVLDPYLPLSPVRRDGSRYCPQCLAGPDGRWMLSWRLPWSFACTIHGILLRDDCPACGPPPRGNLSWARPPASPGPPRRPRHRAPAASRRPAGRPEAATMISRQDQHAPSKTARGTKQGTSKPAQLQPAQVRRREPGEPAQLPVTRPRHAVNDPGLIDSRDVRHPVPVRVNDLIIRAAQHAQQTRQPHPDPDLLPGLPDRRLSRRLAHIDGPAENTPAVVMAGMTDQQQPPGIIHRQHRNRRQQQQLMPDNSPQPGYMRSDTHPGNPSPPDRQAPVPCRVRKNKEQVSENNPRTNH